MSSEFNKNFFKVSIITAVLFMTLACGAGSDGPTQVTYEMGVSNLILSGSGTNVVGAANYVFASSAGVIDSSQNALTATFTDPYLPLSLNSYNGTFYDQMFSGSCTLGTLVANVEGNDGDAVVTDVTATACTDQSVITVYLDTSQVYDAAGNDGQPLLNLNLTVDLAPKVTAAATGNTLANGEGTTESSAGVYTLATDNSVVVTFSKNMTAGTYNATLSGCNAKLAGAGSVVSTSNGNVVVWTLTNLSQVSATDTCTLNVSGVEDAVQNPDDPNDPNISMTITFQ